MHTQSHESNSRLDFMRRGLYWIHLETDSVPLRAEKEELVLELSHESTEYVIKQPVLCFDNRNWANRTGVAACGNAHALPAIMRHTSTHVNLYSWRTSVGQTIMTVSLAGGTCGNPMFGDRCGHLLGRCLLHGINRTRTDRACDSLPGVGVDYWRGLFKTITKLGGSGGDALARRASLAAFATPEEPSIRPDAVVLSYGLHFPDCLKHVRYQSHITFWLGSLRTVFDGPILWRSVSPPQFDPEIHAPSYRPAGCQSTENVTHLDGVVRSLLQAHNATVVNTAHVVAGWANATVDGMHFDGGVLRRRHAANYTLREQPVSSALLDALLEKLRAEAIPRNPMSVRH